MLSRGAGKPVLLQEFGSTSAQFDPQRQARYYNTTMYSALAAGNQGLIAWCFTDADPGVQYHRAPYKRNPHETQFGITDHERNDLPHGREMRRMSQVLQQLDLEGVEPAPIEAGVIVPHEWACGPDYSQYGFPADSLYQYLPDNILHDRTDRQSQKVLIQSWLSTFILCRQAGLCVGFPREASGWSGVPLLLAPSPAASSWGYHVYTPFWRQVRPDVEAGRTLYASLDATCAISTPDAIGLFGASLADRALWRAQVRLTFVEDFFGIQAGEAFEFSAQSGLRGTGVLLNVHDARILARDQDGNPALLVREVGQGYVVLCAYPIEFLLGATPNAFEDVAFCWRLYYALKQLAGIHSPFSVERPEVEVGWLSGQDRDYVILVNHTPGAVKDDVAVSHCEGRARHILPEGAIPVEQAGEGWRFELPGFTGALFEWRHAG
jgi:endo-1,4-beta-mannosidase